MVLIGILIIIGIVGLFAFFQMLRLLAVGMMMIVLLTLTGM